MTNTKYLIIAVFVFVVFAIFITNKNSGRIIQNPPVCQDCNVIIIAFDALGASHVSHLGYKINTTPALDAIVEKGTSFGNAISAAPWTVPSFMSIFTGLYPSEHKVVNKYSVFNKDKQIVANLSELSPNVQTLAEVFKANGYATGGFTGDAGVGAQFGYNKGFDVYTDERTFGSMQNSATHALPWIEQNKDKKLFVFLHGYDDHGQSDMQTTGRFAPRDYVGSYKGTVKEQAALREEGIAKGKLDMPSTDIAFWRGWYDSKIRDADDRFAQFWDVFNRIEFTHKTIVVFLSDHGTEVFEHGRIDHGFSLYDELGHTLLAFVVPGLSSRGIISDQVTTLDVAPTLIALTGISPGAKYLAQLRGKSLLQYLEKGRGDAQDVFMETDYRNYTHKRGVRTVDGWKYVMTMETGEEELYNLNSDPGEMENTLVRYPDKASELKQKVTMHIDAMGASFPGAWIVGCVPVYGDQCK